MMSKTYAVDNSFKLELINEVKSKLEAGYDVIDMFPGLGGGFRVYLNSKTGIEQIKSIAEADYQPVKIALEDGFDRYAVEVNGVEYVTLITRGGSVK